MLYIVQCLSMLRAALKCRLRFLFQRNSGKEFTISGGHDEVGLVPMASIHHLEKLQVY